MAFILALESATKMCSVALFSEDKLIAHKEEKGNYSHAENMANFVQELLDENNLKPSDLNAVAVSKGPGSYTGLRIGVSLAKGLCYSLKIPLISIETLTGIAAKLKGEVPANSLICAMIDARRAEVYTALYDHELNVILPTEAKIIDSNSFEDLLETQPIYFVGDGAEKCKTVLTNKNADFSYGDSTSAKNFGGLAFDKFEKQEFEDVAYFEPFYLKEFIALKGKKLV